MVPCMVRTRMRTRPNKIATRGATRAQDRQEIPSRPVSGQCPRPEGRQTALSDLRRPPSPRAACPLRPQMRRSALASSRTVLAYTAP